MSDIRYFAQLDGSGTVVAVHCVNEIDCLNADGTFSEAVGVAYLQQVHEDATYVESRLDGSIRGRAAAIDGTYLADLDEFRPWQPDPSFTWDDQNGEWIDPNAPVLTEEDIAAIIAQMSAPPTP